MPKESGKRRGKPTYCGVYNIAGKNIKRIRESLDPKCSQNSLAEKIQLEGYAMEKQTVQQIESGEQCITDVELFLFAKVLGVEMSVLLDTSVYGNVKEIDRQTNDYSSSSAGYGTRSVAEKQKK